MPADRRAGRSPCHTDGSRTRSRLAAMRGQPTPVMVSRYLARWCSGRWLARPAGPASRSFLGLASLLLSLRLLEAEVLGGVSAIQLEVASLLVGLRAPLALDTVLGAALAWHRCFELGSWVGRVGLARTAGRPLSKASALVSVLRAK